MNESFDYLKFVPGFDFLKQMAQPGQNAPTANQWVAPTLEPEEIEKRIQELKTVQFWLEQNTKAVGATVQALEVQLMTLKTLKGMNMSMGDLFKSMEIKTPAADEGEEAKEQGSSEKKPNPFAASFAQSPSREGFQAKSSANQSESTQATSQAADGAQFLKDAQQSWMSMQEKAVAMWQEASNKEHSAQKPSSTQDAKEAEHNTMEERQAQQTSAAKANQEAHKEAHKEVHKEVHKETHQEVKSTQSRSSASGLAPDPMQWWGALTEQFSEIATKTLAEIQKHSASLPKEADAPLSPQSPEKTKPAVKAKAKAKVKANENVNGKAKSNAKANAKASAIERVPSQVSAPSKAKAPTKKAAPKSRAKPAAKSSARQLAAKGATSSKAKVTKSALSSVLAKTIADSDANPIQNNARKNAR